MYNASRFQTIRGRRHKKYLHWTRVCLLDKKSKLSTIVETHFPDSQLLKVCKNHILIQWFLPMKKILTVLIQSLEEYVPLARVEEYPP